MRWLLPYTVLVVVVGVTALTIAGTRVELNIPRPADTGQTDTKAAFIAQVQARALDIADEDPGVLAGAGAGLCEALRQRPEQAVTAVPLDGVGPYDTRVLVDAATTHLCPSQRGKVRAYLQGER